MRKISLIRPENCLLNCILCSKKARIYNYFISEIKSQKLLEPFSSINSKNSENPMNDIEIFIDDPKSAIENYSLLQKYEKFRFLLVSQNQTTHDYFVKKSDASFYTIKLLEKLSNENRVIECNIYLPLLNLNLMEIVQTLKYLQNLNIVTNIYLKFPAYLIDPKDFLEALEKNGIKKLVLIGNFKILFKIKDKIKKMVSNGYKIVNSQEQIEMIYDLFTNIEKMEPLKKELCLVEDLSWHGMKYQENGLLYLENKKSNFNSDYIYNKIKKMAESMV